MKPPSRLSVLCLIAVLLAAIDVYIYRYPREFLAVNPKNLGAICSGADLISASEQARQAEAEIDTAAIEKAMNAAQVQGAAMQVPDGCWVTGITVTRGDELIEAGATK